MKCPVCSSDLDRSRYEGLPVFSCGGCNGYLVGTRRVTGIERCREKSPEDLTQEALAASNKDSEDILRCPRCRRPMEKEYRKGSASFHIDKCSDCELIWFDAGELARLQLDFEATPQAQEALRFQNRHRDMTPEEKQEFEKNLSQLPESNSSLASIFGEALMESIVTLGRGNRRWPW